MVRSPFGERHPPVSSHMTMLLFSLLISVPATALTLALVSIKTKVGKKN
jgi:hypothetical protein